MAPKPGISSPETTFVATRILPNQQENTLDTFTLEAGYTTDRVVRETVLAFVRQQRINNPAWVIVIYGPIDPPAIYYTNDDRVWDSRTDL